MSAGELETLVEWLEGETPGGAAYISMHARLIGYFARKGCRAPEELADETLTRVSRRLRDQGTITGVAPAQFCYITARYVFLEYLRKPERALITMRRDVPDESAARDEAEAHEGDLRCLDSCLSSMAADDSALILEYYAGSDVERIASRRALASRLGLTQNALAIRASRIRETLRRCLRRCADRPLT